MMMARHEELSEIDALRESLQDAYSKKDTDEAVEYLIGIYKSGKSYIDAINEIMAEVKEVLLEIMIETGKTDFKNQSGRVFVTKPGVSVRYDTKALDRLIESDPDAAEKILPYRIAKERAGTMTIK